MKGYSVDTTRMLDALNELQWFDGEWPTARRCSDYLELPESVTMNLLRRLHMERRAKPVNSRWHTWTSAASKAARA